MFETVNLVPGNASGSWLALCGGLLIVWNESGENIFIFCYRIGWGAFSVIRARTLPLVTISSNLTRTAAACCTQSFISSAPFTILKD